MADGQRYEFLKANNSCGRVSIADIRATAGFRQLMAVLACSVKKATGKTRRKVQLSCMDGKIHEVTTLWWVITIHRWKVVLLLQQCGAETRTPFTAGY